MCTWRLQSWPRAMALTRRSCVIITRFPSVGFTRTHSPTYASKAAEWSARFANRIVRHRTCHFPAFYGKGSRCRRRLRTERVAWQSWPNRNQKILTESRQHTNRTAARSTEDIDTANRGRDLETRTHKCTGALATNLLDTGKHQTTSRTENDVILAQKTATYACDQSSSLRFSGDHRKPFDSTANSRLTYHLLHVISNVSEDPFQ